MKLERTLTELQTLVEYGCYYLVKSAKEIKDVHPLEILPFMHQSDILTYTIGNFSFDEILDEMNECDVHDEICSWVRSNLSIGDVGYMTYDVKNYVTENWDVDDIFDEYDIKDYVKDNFDMEDVYDDDYLEDRARDMVDDMSLNEILDIKGMEDEDVLDCLSNSSIVGYVTERYNVLDLVNVEWQ